MHERSQLNAQVEITTRNLWEAYRAKIIVSMRIDPDGHVSGSIAIVSNRFGKDPLQVSDKCFSPAQDFLAHIGHKQYRTILADPPWQFVNRTGKMAPEHRRLSRYSTLSLDQIKEIPVPLAAAEHSHLYLWIPNALLPQGLEVMERWGFEYKTHIIWHKVRQDGAPDGRGVGFYFRNTTEMVLFGVRGRLRTLAPGRRQVNIIRAQKREHSRKPDELYAIIEACSPGPRLELFARSRRAGWEQWGNQMEGPVLYRGDPSSEDEHIASLEVQRGNRE